MREWIRKFESTGNLPLPRRAVPRAKARPDDRRGGRRFGTDPAEPVRTKVRRHVAKIVTSDMPDLPLPGADASGPDVLRIGTSRPIYNNGSFGRVSGGAGLSRAVRDVLARERFDVVHVHCPLTPVLPYLAVHHARVPVVGTFHTHFNIISVDSLGGALRLVSRLYLRLRNRNPSGYSSSDDVYHLTIKVEHLWGPLARRLRENTPRAAMDSRMRRGCMVRVTRVDSGMSFRSLLGPHT